MSKSDSVKKANRIKLGTEIPGGKQVCLDIDVLLTTRLLIQANSGGGKSWTLRRILEQSHKRVQHLVIDPEGEFSSLRERYDYVVAGRGGDVATEPRIAALLAHRLLDLRASAVLDLYEMRTMAERRRFVRLFLEALVDAPKKLWHPVLVVLDEAHAYCPEGKEAESSDAVIALAQKGRKRGFCSVFATQRLAAMSKDAAAQCGNVLIGPTTMDNDLKRATQAFAMSGAKARETMETLMRLGPGEFLAQGRAISREPVLVQVGGCETRHPEVAMGRKTSLAPPPPPAAVKSLLPKLGDLPKEAEEEIQERTALKQQVRDLRAEVTAARRGASEAQRQAEAKATEEQINRLVGKAITDRDAEHREAAKQLEAMVRRMGAVLREVAEKAAAAAGLPMPEMPAPAPAPPIPHVVARRAADSARKPRQAKGSVSEGEVHLRAGAVRMLETLARHYPTLMTWAQLATLSGFTASGGTFGTYMGDLQRAGYIHVQGKQHVEITEAGLDRVGHMAPEPMTLEERLERWRGALRKGERQMLDALLEIHPESMSREDLAEKTGFAVSGGTFGTYLGVLRRNGLLEVSGQAVKASETLFME